MCNTYEQGGSVCLSISFKCEINKKQIMFSSWYESLYTYEGAYNDCIILNARNVLLCVPFSRLHSPINTSNQNLLLLGVLVIL